MKKVILLFSFFPMFVVPCVAQNYQIYVVKGDVKCNDGETEKKVSVGMLISADTKLSIPEGGRVVILDETNMKLQALKSGSAGPIGKLLEDGNTSVQHLTESYLAYIKSKMTESGDLKEKNYRQTAGTAFRDPDSLLLQMLFPDNDTLNNCIIH